MSCCAEPLSSPLTPASPWAKSSLWLVDGASSSSPAQAVALCSFLGDVCVLLAGSLVLSLSFSYCPSSCLPWPLFLYLHVKVMKCDSSIHFEVCLSCELIHRSPTFILLWGVQGGASTDPQAITRGKLRDDLAVTYGWSARNLRVAGCRVSIHRHWWISIRPISVRPPAVFFRDISDIGTQVAEWRPDGGCCRISEITHASPSRMANFNCELKWPGRRRISCRWVLCWQITAGFFADEYQKLTAIIARLIFLYLDVSFTQIAITWAFISCV